MVPVLEQVKKSFKLQIQLPILLLTKMVPVLEQEIKKCFNCKV